MTPLLSWLLLLALAAWGVALACTWAVWYDRQQQLREWEQSLEQWRRMCEALEMEDLDETESE